MPRIFFVVTSLVLLTTAACVHGGRTRGHRSSSVVAYLYPNQANPRPLTSLPVLRLPLRVGIAFVPSEQGSLALSGQQQESLLRRVADQFKNRDYIESIEVIPASYLQPRGGFANLRQIKRLLNVDVIALVAFDQVQFTDQNFLSLAYWTIVGAYVFQGNKNDTQTLMEAAVYDIDSRRLLFRAPGASHVQGGSAAVYVSQNLRKDSLRSFEAATDDLVANLKTQLESFRERAKNAPAAVARIEHKPGYRGGGTIEAWFVLALAALAGARVWRRQR